MPEREKESHVEKAVEHINKVSDLADKAKNAAQEAKDEVKQIRDQPGGARPEPSPPSTGQVGIRPSPESDWEEPIDPPEETGGGTMDPPSVTRPDY